LLVLHAFLLFRRLAQEGAAGRDLAQAVFDRMFDDMDDVLRESGVGDLSIHRKIRGMSEAFYGRIKAYDEALAGEGAALEAAFARNVYAGEAGAAPCLLARYVRAAGTAFAAQGFGEFEAGQIRFPAPEEALP